MFELLVFWTISDQTDPEYQIEPSLVLLDPRLQSYLTRKTHKENKNEPQLDWTEKKKYPALSLFCC